MSQKMKIRNLDSTSELHVQIGLKLYKMAPAGTLVVTIPANTQIMGTFNGHPTDAVQVEVG